MYLGLRRRELLFGWPALALADAAPGSIAETERDREVLAFWVRELGVAPQSVGLPADYRVRPPVSTSVGALRASSSINEYIREPAFFHYDEKERRMVAAEEIPRTRLPGEGDSLVDFDIQRHRFNGEDQDRFRHYTSGAMYLDLEQRPPMTAESASFAWSVFGAIFPQAGKKLATAGLKPIAMLGASNPAQTIALPGGAGRCAFGCFVKNQKKTAFGKFVSAFAELSGPASMPGFLPMLGLPAIATPTLLILRSLVARLQVQGGQHEWLFQNRPLEVATTAEAANANPTSVRLVSGSYIAVPKGQIKKLKGQLEGLRIVDGFLVPNDADRFDVAETAPQTLTEMSYVSFEVKVRKTRLNVCNSPLR